MHNFIKNYKFGGLLCFYLSSTSFSDASKIEPSYDKPILIKGVYHNYINEKPLTHRIESVSIFGKTLTDVSSYFAKNYSAEDWNMQSVPENTSDALKITWIGHSTFLIQVNNKNILTDPLFYDFNTTLYPRKTPIGIKLENLPQKIDAVLISHNHRDHMDEQSLKFLQKHSDPLCIVPQGDYTAMKKLGFTKIKEFTWWQTHELDTIKFEFLPAIHWSGRGLFDLNTSLWGSWMIITKNENIYFCGDSAYGKHFKKIAEKYSTIDVALMPIGPTNPPECRNSHMDASEAVNAFIDLNAKNFIPMHWGTFRLGPDSFDTSINILDEAWEQKDKDLQNKKLITLKFGETFTTTEITKQKA